MKRASLLFCVFTAAAFADDGRIAAEALVSALESLSGDAAAFSTIKDAVAPAADPADVIRRRAARVVEDDRFWAFRPVQRHDIPASTDSAWITNPIDAFIADKLRTAGLKPSPIADRRTLIRRVYLDVLGLPPTPEAVESFVADKSPDAYARLVDGVLASPHYGERWARHWLDVVRYADSNGFEMNKPRYNAWHYRDYVIRALNEDKPYTEFITDQLAGDVTGAFAATGFMVAGPMDEVKSPDVVLTRSQRDQELHDVTSSTAAVFLGLTVGCAKCHDHKFDPISQHDYFALRAVFAGVKHGDQDLPDPNRDERLRQAAELRQELAAHRGKLLRLARDEQPDGLRRRVSTMENVERFATVEAKFVRFTIHGTSDIEPCIDELEVFAADVEPVNVALAARGAVATASSVFPANTKHKTEHLNDGRYGNDYSWIPQSREESWAMITLPEITKICCVAWARDREGNFRDRIIVDYLIETSIDGSAWRTVASSQTRQPFDSGAPLPPLFAPEKLSESDAAMLAQLQEREKQLRAELAARSTGPRIYAPEFAQPNATFLLQRGDPMMERQYIAPATPSHVGLALQMGAGEPEQQRRLRLAEWLCSDENPLTARVIVNRIWQHHFGAGIVNSPSDFGAMGNRPSHPELLDWLAIALKENAWSLKSVHRLILLSSTYRQSSAPNEAAERIDSESRLLWRFPPRRLEAEPLRDSILQIAGELDLTMGGPGFDVFEPDDSYVHIYIPKTKFTRAEKRRMVYQWKPRVEQDVTFGIFDCPDASQAMPSRNTSISPLQALNLLNSPFMSDQADCFAKRVLAETNGSHGAAVTRSYALALQRGPSAEEHAGATALITQHGLPALCRALLNASEFLYLN
ncbi:MAG: DUF1553 domain-containing protein [Candidatus Hydrogenedentes bacterium]|nr:DUF1553 domain-containing protein [Candidatus Hydrogenedentota bacterium]